MNDWISNPRDILNITAESASQHYTNLWKTTDMQFDFIHWITFSLKSWLSELPKASKEHLVQSFAFNLIKNYDSHFRHKSQWKWVTQMRTQLISYHLGSRILGCVFFLLYCLFSELFFLLHCVVRWVSPIGSFKE